MDFFWQIFSSRTLLSFVIGRTLLVPTMPKSRPAISNGSTRKKGGPLRPQSKYATKTALAREATSLAAARAAGAASAAKTFAMQATYFGMQAHWMSHHSSHGTARYPPWPSAPFGHVWPPAATPPPMQQTAILNTGQGTNKNNVGIKVHGKKIMNWNNRGRITIAAYQAIDEMYIVPDMSKSNPEEFGEIDIEERKSRVRYQEQYSVGSHNVGRRAKDYAVSPKAIEEGKNVLVIDHTNLDINFSNGTIDKTTGEFVHDGVQHAVSVRRVVDNSWDVVGSLSRQIYEKWVNKKGNASRNNFQGEMFVIGSERGTGTGNHRHLLRGPTRMCADGKGYDGLNEIHKEINILVNEICKEHFPRMHKCVKDVMNALGIGIPEILGGSKGFSPSLNQSAKRSIIQSHFDKDVAPESVVFWHSTNGKDPPGWYFFMPDSYCEISGKKYYGIAIRLRNGIAISWRGGDLRHGSTFPLEYQGDLLGTWFGLLIR